MFSFAPEDFTQGALPNECTATIVLARCEINTYNGQGPNVPAIRFDLKLDGSDKPITQYWGNGKLERTKPSADGERFESAIPGEELKGLAGGSNAALLMQSLVNARCPIELLKQGRISAFTGMKLKLKKVKVERGEMEQTAGSKPKEGKGGDGMVPIVQEILALPGAAGAGAPAAAAAAPAGATAAAPSVGGEAAVDVAQGAILELLMENGGSMTKGQLTSAVFKKLDGNPLRQAAIKLLGSEEFMGSGPWNWDAGTKTATAA